MVTIPWPFLVPLGVILLVAIFLSADVETSHAENASTQKLRAMNIALGLVAAYGGFLIWFFEVESGRLRPPWNRPFGFGLMCIGIIYSAGVLLMSRARLVRDSQVHSRPSWEQDYSGQPDVSPADRVGKNRSLK